MWNIYDPDEWENVIETRDYGRDPFGNHLGSCSFYQRRRSPEDIAKIKAEKQRQHEDAVLAEAAEIRRQRFGIV